MRGLSGGSAFLLGWAPFVLGLLGFSAGCTKPSVQVVLMADAQGKVGAVEVRNAGGRQRLDQLRQSVLVPGRGGSPGLPETLSESQVQDIFQEAMEAQPKAPLHFILQFETGTTSLTQASRPLIAQILEAIRARQPLDVSVVGHTDTAGSEERNNLLARQRAEAVAKLLVEGGADPNVLEIRSHGKAVPLITTGDQVPEPRNRRVEVTVR